MAAYSLNLASKAVTTAGTRVPLSATTQLCAWLSIQAAPGNVQDVFVGDVTVSSTRGYILKPVAPGQQPNSWTIAPGDALNLINLAEVYVDASADGEGVNYLFIVR